MTLECSLREGENETIRSPKGHTTTTKCWNYTNTQKTYNKQYGKWKLLFAGVGVRDILPTNVFNKDVEGAGKL
jgi:hypothetical protein